MKTVLIFCVLTLSYLIKQINSQNLSVKIGEIKNIELKKDEQKYFTIKDFDYNHDIVITTLPGNDQAFEKIKFTVKNLSDYDCSIDRLYGFCALNPTQIQSASYIIQKGANKGKSSVQVYMTCLESTCNVDLMVNNKNNGLLHDKMQIDFKENDIQVFDLQLPQKFERIIVPIQFQGRKEPLDNLSVQIEGQQLAFMQKHIVDDVFVLEFRYDKNVQYCKGCDYIIQMIGDKFTTVDIMKFEYLEENRPTLNIDEVYIDSVIAENPQQYQVQVPQNLQEFSYLKMTFKFLRDKVTSSAILNGSLANQQFGANNSASIGELVKNTVSMAQNQKEMEDLEYNKEFSLIFRKDEVGGSFLGKTFNFIVYSFATEFVNISVDTVMEPIIPMYLDQIFASKLKKDAYDFYMIKVPNLGNLNESQQITLTLKTISGENKAFVYKMNSEKDFRTQLPQNQSDFPVQQVKSALQAITFDSSCENKAKFCFFQVFVVGVSDYEVQYQLELAQTDREQKIILRENEAFSDAILQHEYKDYEFYYDVKDAEKIKSIEVRVSTQLLQVYVGAKGRCENARPSCPKVLKGTDVKPVVITKFKKTYANGIVISVFSSRATDFTITVDVNWIEDSSIIALTEAHYTASELNSNYVGRYFVYDSDMGDEEDLIINVRGPSNKCIILVNNDGSFPDLGNDLQSLNEQQERDEDTDDEDEEQGGYQWISRHNYLRLWHKTTKQDFQKKGQYIIAVFAAPGVFERSGGLAHIPFKIMVTQSKSYKVLDFNEAYFDTTIPKGIQHYQILVNPKTENRIYLSRNILNNEEVHQDLNFYIMSENRPNITDYEYKLRGEEKATFEMGGTVLERLCGLDNEYCSILIAVENSGLQKIQYSITMWEQDIGIQLQEGYQFEYTLFHINRYMNFYFIPNDRSSTLNFHMFSYFGLTNFTMKVFENTENHDISQFPFPSDSFGILEKDHLNTNEIDYTSGIHNSHSISLTTQQMSYFTPHTVILISVGFMEQNNQSDKKAGEDKFSIVVSSQFQQIHSGQRKEFTLVEHESKYSFFSLNNILKNEKDDVFIQLTTLSGQASIAVSIRDDHNDRMPLVTKNDFMTFSNYMEVTQKQIQNIIQKEQLSKFSNPTLVIQVESWLGSGKFVLEVTNSQTANINVLHGVPSEFHLQKKQARYFRYYNYQEEDIQIRLVRDYGIANMGVISCEQWADCEDGEVDLQFISGQSGSLIEIKRDTEIWCVDCYYLITVINYDLSEMHGFLYVLLDNDAVWLQEGRTFVDNNDQHEDNLYMISAPSNEEVYLSLVVHWGNPKVYINYYYETDSSKFTQGPFRKDQASNLIHIKIPAKDDIVDQDSKNKDNQEDEVSEFGKNINENTFYKRLVENQIYILVSNPDWSVLASNYTISYTAGENNRYISDGNILPFQLSGKQHINFVHQYYDSAAQALLSINLDNYREVNIDSIKVITHLQAQESRVQENDEVKLVELQLITKSKSHMTFALPPDKGAYNIKIENTGFIKASLTIYVNARDITFVPQGHKINHYLVKDAINYYEMIVPYSGLLALDLSHCMGLIHYGFTQKYEEFVDHNFNNTTKEPSVPGTQYLDIINVKKGNFYLAIMTSEQEDALYTLKYQFYKNETMVPHYKLDPGQGGFIQVDRSTQGQIYLEFSPIQCTGCTSQEIREARVQYTVMWSIDLEILNVMGKCEATNFFDHQISTLQNDVLFTEELEPSKFNENSSLKSKSFELGLDQSQRLNFTFPIQQIKSQYYVSVKSVIHNFPNVYDDIVITYNNVQVGQASTYMMMGGVERDLMFVGAFTLIILFLLAALLALRRVFRPKQDITNQRGKSSKFYKQNQNPNKSARSDFEAFDQQDIDSQSGTISILDTSTPLKTESEPKINTAIRKSSQEEDAQRSDFTFSKKLMGKDGLQEFNKFEDDDEI